MGKELDQTHLEVLTKGIGPTLVEALIGIPLHTLDSVRSGVTKLDDQQIEAVEVAHEVFELLMANEELQTTRLWFIGVNPHLDVSEITALRERNFDAVRASAQGLVDNTFGSAI